MGEATSRSGRQYKIKAFVEDDTDDDFSRNKQYRIQSGANNKVVTFGLDDLLEYVSEDYLESVSYHNFEGNTLQQFKVNSVRKYEDKTNGTTTYQLIGKARFDKFDDYQDVTLVVKELPEQFKKLFEDDVKDQLEGAEQQKQLDLSERIKELNQARQ